MTFRIDLNCDMGESFGAYRMGNDEAILDFVNSANIACGFHAGDPSTIHKTVEAALAKGVAVGAHPGLPDLQGFGRRTMAVSSAEAYDMVVYQVGALAGFAQALGGRIAHVKAHGALYNMAAKDPRLAEAIAKAVHDFDRRLVLFGLAGSAMIQAAEDAGLRSASEVFADRTYQDDGSLTPRGHAECDDSGRGSLDRAGEADGDGRCRALGAGQGRSGPCRHAMHSWRSAERACVCEAHPRRTATSRRRRQAARRAIAAGPARMARQAVEAEVGGTVAKIERREGERVARDEPIMMLELMKMEIPIAAPADGTLVRLLVAEGDLVTEGQQVAILETP